MTCYECRTCLLCYRGECPGLARYTREACRDAGREKERGA